LLLNKTYPAKFRKALETRLRKRGVNIVFNDYVDDIPEAGPSVKTRKGKSLKADLVVSHAFPLFILHLITFHQSQLNTRGPRPNTEFISSSLSGAVTDRGLVKVKPTLQLTAYPDIFAVGDVLDIAEEKQVAKAQTHAAIVAANVLSYLAGGSLKPYKGSMEMIVVTIGKVCLSCFVTILELVDISIS
jgi:NADH dehydrogenase FAD-containing subunit